MQTQEKLDRGTLLPETLLTERGKTPQGPQQLCLPKAD